MSMIVFSAGSLTLLVWIMQYSEGRLGGRHGAGPHSIWCYGRCIHAQEETHVS